MIEELTRAEILTRPCVDAAVWSMPEPQLIDALDAVHRLEQRLIALKLALVRELDGRGTAVTQGATSTAVWLRERLRLTVPAARRLVALAGAVDAQPVTVREALADGRIDAEQARVIAETAASVHVEAGPPAAAQAVDLLVEWAGQFDATLLRRLGARILDHVAPEVAERAAERALEAEAARADRDRHLTVSNFRDGRLRLSGSLDVETATLLRAAIEPLTAPTGPDDARTPGQRRHDALGDLCRLALRTGDLPEHGGDPAQVVVTTSYDVLTRRLRTGTLDSSLALPAETVRRLACDAAILPAVLGGAGQVLDVGRQRRLITGPLRRALVLRDRGCAFPGCDRPPRWCEAHHLRHWSDGGETSLANAVLLCRHHHRQVHHHDWHVRLAGDGFPEFLPPAWLDPDRRPRRNHHHRPHARTKPFADPTATAGAQPRHEATATAAPRRPDGATAGAASSARATTPAGARATNRAGSRTGATTAAETPGGATATPRAGYQATGTAAARRASAGPPGRPSARPRPP